MTCFEVCSTPDEAEYDRWRALVTARGKALVGTDASASWRLALGILLALVAGLACVGLDTTTPQGGFLVVLLVLGAYVAGQGVFAQGVVRTRRELRRIEHGHGPTASTERCCRIDAAGVYTQGAGSRPAARRMGWPSVPPLVAGAVSYLLPGLGHIHARAWRLSCQTKRAA